MIFGRTENIMGKGENAGCPECFQKLSLLRSLKLGIVIHTKQCIPWIANQISCSFVMTFLGFQNLLYTTVIVLLYLLTLMVFLFGTFCLFL